MPRADFRFSFPKRVRFAEVDAQAVVFNPRYLEYFDIGLVEYWRAAGLYSGPGLAGAPDAHVRQDDDERPGQAAEKGQNEPLVLQDVKVEHRSHPFLSC